MTERPVFRFAPSPNGELHLGHALSALVGLRAARAVGGRFLLRIEDIDRERSTDAYEQAIYDDLAWLGMSWETPVRRQSAHMADYAAALAKLAARGLIYPCFATRGEIARAAGTQGPRDPDGSPLYPGLWRDAPAHLVEERENSGARFALRLHMARALALVREDLFFVEHDQGPSGENGPIAAKPEQWGDVVLARKDNPASYHLCVVVDDALQDITHVTRGRDLFQATHLHRLLQALLDLPVPHYSHHRLIVDGSGRKLSKSARDTSLRQLRAAGWSPSRIMQTIGLA